MTATFFGNYAEHRAEIGTGRIFIHGFASCRVDRHRSLKVIRAF